MSVPLLSLTLLAPLLGALVILAIPERLGRAVRVVALLSALVPLATSLMLLSRYDLAAGGFQFVERYALVPALGISWHLGVDGIAVPLVLLTAIIQLTAVTTSWTVPTRAKEFYLFVGLLVAGVYGVFVSLDLFVLFLFYELAVLPMYVLIGVWGSSMEIEGRGPFARVFGRVRVGLKEYGAMKLTLYLLAGSGFLLAGIFYLWVDGGRQIGIASFDYLELSLDVFRRDGTDPLPPLRFHVEEPIRQQLVAELHVGRVEHPVLGAGAVLVGVLAEVLELL